MSALDAQYSLLEGAPSQADYLRLRVAAGLSQKSAVGAARGLPNTIFGVTIDAHGQIVGMGRIIGDGGLFYQVVDIAVEPGHQGRGLGRQIVGRLVEYLQANAPAGAYVSLIADGEAARLYAQFGFQPTAPASIGMAFEIPTR